MAHLSVIQEEKTCSDCFVVFVFSFSPFFPKYNLPVCWDSDLEFYASYLVKLYYLYLSSTTKMFYFLIINYSML